MFDPMHIELSKKIWLSYFVYSGVPHANLVIQASQCCKTVFHYHIRFPPILSNRIGCCTRASTRNLTSHTTYRCIVQLPRRQNLIREIPINSFIL